MSPELCLCSKKSWTVAFVSHRLGLQARDILRSIFASLGGLNIEETRTSSFPCTSCNRRVDSLPLIPSVWAQNTPGYNNKIPPQTTPDTFDDLPTKETSQKVYDNLDLMRGVEVFLNFISAASLEAILRARRNRVTKSNQVLIFEQLLDSTPEILVLRHQLNILQRKSTERCATDEMCLARAFQPMSCSGRQARPQLSFNAANLERGVAARARAGATQPSASHS